MCRCNGPMASSTSTTSAMPRSRVGRSAAGKLTQVSEEPQRAEREDGHSQSEREDGRVLGAAVLRAGGTGERRQIAGGELGDEGEEKGAACSAAERAHAADDHDDQGVDEPCRIRRVRLQSELRRAHAATEADESCSDEEGDREDQLDVDPEGGDHRAIVDAGADGHPDPGLLEPEPEPDADRDGDEEHEQAEDAVPDAGDVEVPEAVEVDEAVRLAGPGDVPADPDRAFELVDDDDRDRDRDQRLAEL